MGGKLYVRLLGECDYCNQINQIDNTKYGFPGTAQTTSMTQRGWLAFAPTEQFAGNSYDVCAKTVAEVRKGYEAKVPMRRGCTTADVMKAVYYLIDQKYETGQAIPVTGGQIMR